MTSYRLVFPKKPTTSNVVTLATAHTPAGYTKDKPLRLGNKDFVGGQFIPPNYLAKMTPEQRHEMEVRRELFDTDEDEADLRGPKPAAKLFDGDKGGAAKLKEPAAPAVAAAGEHVEELNKIPTDDQRRVGGLMVKRQGPDKFRIEQQDGKGFVDGNAEFISQHIATTAKNQQLYGRQVSDALARADAYTEPDPWTNPEGLEKAAAAFDALPVGTAVVSLDDHAGTRGRVGKIVTDPKTEGKRVKLDGEDGYATNDVEPLDSKLSWRVVKGKQPKQAVMFDAEPEAELPSKVIGDQFEKAVAKPEDVAPVPSLIDKKMTATKAAWALDAIRNDRSLDDEDRAKQVDEIGAWLAGQGNGQLVQKLLKEAHELQDKLRGGSGKGGNRIKVVSNGPIIKIPEYSKPKPQYDTYEAFRDEYKKLFEKMSSYTPDQVGMTEYAGYMANLADTYPEWTEKAEEEGAPDIKPEPSAERHDAIYAELKTLYASPEFKAADWLTLNKVHNLQQELNLHKPAAVARAQAEIDAEQAKKSLHVGRKWQSPEGERQVVSVRADGRLEVTQPGLTSNEIISPAELENRVAFDEKAATSRAGSKAKLDAEKSSNDAAQAKLADTDGYADQFTPMQRQKAVAALNHSVQQDGRLISRKDLIRDAVADGATIVNGPNGERRLQRPNGNFVEEARLSKTGMDYAAFLIGKNAPPPAARPETFFKGDRAEYTGNSEEIGGKLYHEVEMMEGHLKGETRLVANAPSGQRGEDKSQPEAEPEVSVDALEKAGMIRPWGSGYQWRSGPNSSWMTANSREGAIEAAAKYYNPPPIQPAAEPEPSSDPYAIASARKMPGPIKSIAGGKLGYQFLVAFEDGQTVKADGRNRDEAVKAAIEQRKAKEKPADVQSGKPSLISVDDLADGHFKPLTDKEIEEFKIKGVVGGDSLRLVSGLSKVSKGSEWLRDDAAKKLAAHRDEIGKMLKEMEPHANREEMNYSQFQHAHDIMSRALDMYEKDKPASIQAVDPVKVPVDELVKAKDEEFAGKSLAEQAAADGLPAVPGARPIKHTLAGKDVWGYAMDRDGKTYYSFDAHRKGQQQTWNKDKQKALESAQGNLKRVGGEEEPAVDEQESPSDAKVWSRPNTDKLRPWKFIGYAQTDGGGRGGHLAVDSGGDTAEEAERGARLELVRKWNERKPDEPEEEPAPLDEKESASVGAHVDLAKSLAARMAEGEQIDAKTLQRMANEAHGGTKAEGKWDPSGAYDSLEAAFNMNLRGKTDPRADLEQAQEQAREILADINKLPTQTNRSGNKDAFQQFSTPPHYSFAVAWAANINPGEVVLEPSAGTGCLAVQAENAGADVYANEYDPKRADFLKDMFGDDKVHIVDAEQISAILPKKGVPSPTTILMNPPFSQTAGRMGDKKELLTGANHIAEAMRMLAPNGRLVALVGEGMKPEAPRYADWFEKMKQKYNFRANIGVDGDEYKKYGTHFGTRVLVFDKTAPNENGPVIGDAADIPDLMAKLAEVRNDRPTNIEPDAGLPVGGGMSSEDQRPARTGSQPDGGVGSGLAGQEPAGGGRVPGRPAGLPVENVGTRSDSDESLPEQSETVRPDGGEEPVPSGGDPASASQGGVEPHEKPKRKRGRKSAGQQPAQQPEPDGPKLRAPERLNVQNKPPEVSGEDESGGLYTQYKPSKMSIDGMQAHRSPLVESSAMAAIQPPDPTYQPLISPDLVEKGILSDALLENLVYFGQAHSSFLPSNPGQPVVRRAAMTGDGTGCVAPWTKIFNPLTGQETEIEVLAKIGKSHTVLALTADGFQPCTAQAPFRKGVARLYCVTLENGQVVTVTGHHRFLTPQGWTRIDDGLHAGHFLACAEDRPVYGSVASRLARDGDDQRSSRRPEDCLDRCFGGHDDLCDALPRSATGNDQEQLPLPADVREHSPCCPRMDDQESLEGHSHPDQQPVLHSRSNSCALATRDRALNEAPSAASSFQSSAASRLAPQQSLSLKGERRLTESNNSRQSAQHAVGYALASPPSGFADEFAVASALAVLDIELSDNDSSKLARQARSDSQSKWQPQLPHPEVEQSAFSCDYDSGWDRIRSIEFVGVGPYFDMYVPGPENYLAEGIVHHNTGKTRQFLAAMWDNWNQGRKKHLIVTKSEDLIPQFKAEMKKIGWNPDLIHAVDFDKIANGTEPEEGISLISYPKLRSGPDNPDKPRNADALLKWLGPDFDGVISFDESHLMANSMDKDPLGGEGIGGMRGQGGGASAQAEAGLKLINGLPNSRILFASATGASKLQNLAYCADRLGLCGPGSGFASKEDFMREMDRGGVAALEAVAQSLKARGVYSSRNLSYKGVTTDTVKHELTPEQRYNYDKLSEGWRTVFNHVNEALQLTGGDRNGMAVSRAMGTFQSAQQYFFNQVITSMMAPSLIKQVQADIDAGMSPVIQVYNTLGQQTDKEIKARSAEEGYDDIDLSPRSILSNYLVNAFPTDRYEQYKDENGNIRSRPVLDYSNAQKLWGEFERELGSKPLPEAEENVIRLKHGIPLDRKKPLIQLKNNFFTAHAEKVKDPEAEAKKAQLLEEIKSFSIPALAIDQVLEHFGHDRVAEVTGRNQRLVPDEDGRMVPHKMGKGFSAAEGKAFQDGAKDILVFSLKKGGTGFDFHADKDAGNSKRRAHHLLQLGWKADDAVQAFGRTNRTNQTEPPHYWNYEIPEIPGQKRFSEIVKARLEALMSLSRGSSKTGKDILNAGVDLNSPQGTQALEQFKRNILTGAYEDLGRTEFHNLFALRPENDQSSEAEEKANSKLAELGMNQFLNRMLAVPLARQRDVFDKYADILGQVVTEASKNGTLGVGTSDFDEDVIDKISDKPLTKDATTGAESRHLVVKTKRKNYPFRWSDVKDMHKMKTPQVFVRNEQTGKLWAVSPWTSKTDPESGNIIERVALTSPLSQQIISKSELATKYNPDMSDQKVIKDDWDAEVSKVPEFTEREQHFVTGDFLPIWKKIPTSSGSLPRIYRLNVNGKNVVGRHVPPSKVGEFLKNMGLDNKSVIEPKNTHASLENGSITAKLDNGWTLKPVRYGHERRIELIGPSSFHWNDLVEKGVIKEKGSDYKIRLFVPTGKDGSDVLDRIAKDNKIVEEIPTKSSVVTLSSLPTVIRITPNLPERPAASYRLTFPNVTNLQTLSSAPKVTRTPAKPAYRLTFRKRH